MTSEGDIAAGDVSARRQRHDDAFPIVDAATDRTATGRGGEPVESQPDEEGNELSYVVHMSTTITIRTEESLREALERRADEEGKTISEVVREILLESLEERPVGQRAGQLKGRLKIPRRGKEAWRARLRERNWRS